MREYEVKITETLEKVVYVQAESRKDAEELVHDQWYKGEYILDADNFTGATFDAELKE